MLTMSAVWDRTAEFLRDHRRDVVAVAGLAIFAPAALSGIVAPLRPGAGAGLTAALGLLGLATSLVSVWGQAAVCALALDPAQSLRRALAGAGRRLALIVGLGLAVGIGLGLLLLPVIGILAAGGADFTAMAAGTAPDIGPGTAGGIALYGLVLLPVLLWLAARLSLVTPVVLAERLGFASFRRSFALTRGLAMRIIGVVLLYAVVTIVAMLAARFVFGTVLALIAGGEGRVSVASVLTAVVTAAVSAGFSVLAAAFTAKLYLAARDRSPGRS